MWPRLSSASNVNLIEMIARVRHMWLKRNLIVSLYLSVRCLPPTTYEQIHVLGYIRRVDSRFSFTRSLCQNRGDMHRHAATYS
jgi:hypothetical protein